MTPKHRNFLHDMDKLICNNRELIADFDSRSTVMDTERGAALIKNIDNLARIVADMINWEEVQS